KRYVPPVRTSASQERKDTPNDFGAHHRLSSSGLVQASNTICAGPSKVRVTTSSRSDFRSTAVPYFVGLISLSLLSSIGFRLLFQSLDKRVHPVEASGPALAVPLDPCRPSSSPRRPSLQVRTRPTFSVVTSPACSKTPTCFFMPVRVM